MARTVAGLAGQELVEMALSGGTDTSDLLGGFEQLEPRRRLQVAYSMCHLALWMCPATLKYCCYGLKLPE